MFELVRSEGTRGSSEIGNEEVSNGEVTKTEVIYNENEPKRSEIRPSSRKQNANYLFKYLLICNFLQYLEAGAVPALLIELEHTFGMTSGQQVTSLVVLLLLTLTHLQLVTRDCWEVLYTCPYPLVGHLLAISCVIMIINQLSFCR